MSLLSGIPYERVEIAKGYGTFPHEVSVLEIHDDLNWNLRCETLASTPLYINTDGSVLYFRLVHWSSDALHPPCVWVSVTVCVCSKYVCMVWQGNCVTAHMHVVNNAPFCVHYSWNLWLTSSCIPPLHSGSFLLVCRDSEEKLKELTKEEKDELRKQENQR